MEVQGNFGPILTQNPQMKSVIKSVSRIAASDVNVLIMGESGTGKNLLSRAIHNASTRQDQTFLAINCMTIPETLMESELFGHEKGAYTDAKEFKQGFVEAAKGGTIFFDEIGDMQLIAQGKMLQVIEEKKFRRVGGDKLIDTDVRVVSATNKDLSERVKEGAFRQDLYYRLNEVSITLPPLRERQEDIPFLIRNFVECYGHMFGKPKIRISNAAVNYLCHYSWPGNFREMKNVIKSAVLLCPQETIWLEHFPFEITLQNAADSPQSDELQEARDFSLEAVVKSQIEKVLKFYDGNKKKSAEALHISRPRLDRYIQKFQIL